ncbi:hypothetical protein Y032_0058g2931 [Ancylostoma ceylanicum]|uniref:Uncharacterized protein n=1 Tax=Ancylostoma ceylanicum TaxID=53326 RepID=A0A016U588_9BILA|nr:hypothetical protein Y032_0058g2931 [Ancylostoma ceylanicum]
MCISTSSEYRSGLNAYVAYIVCGGNLMYQCSASSTQTPWYQYTDPEEMEGLVGLGRDRTMDYASDSEPLTTALFYPILLEVPCKTGNRSWEVERDLK